ncbi:MAG TPA: zinc ribbon domain-containing protein [Opitutaceae bacterium]|nr:zinc ribbon domain-containing protein [Opitutaceae bacterium]
MPTYEYACLKCKKTFETFQSMKDKPLAICGCGKKGRVKRLLGGGGGIIFKGSGFHQTDYKKAVAPTADKPAADKKTTADKPAKPAAV